MGIIEMIYPNNSNTAGRLGINIFNQVIVQLGANNSSRCSNGSSRKGHAPMS